MCSTVLQPPCHAGDPCGCWAAGAPRCPAAEAKAWEQGGRSSSHPDTELGDAQVRALEQQLGVLCKTLGSHREEIIHLCVPFP